MATKKPIRKVEIADETVVNLKSNDKQKEDFSFHIHHIQDDDDGEREVPIHERYAAPEALTARVSRSPKIDPDELNQRMESFAEKLEKAVIKVAPSENAPAASNVASEPKDLIRVKFEKFVQLVATKDFLSILEKNRDEDVVLSSNLLTDLASAVEEKTEKKSPVIFLVGLAIGVILTYLLINK